MPEITTNKRFNGTTATAHWVKLSAFERDTVNIGYLILVLFALLFISIAFFVSRRFPSDTTDDFLVAGRSLPYPLVAASVVISWTWVTTIMAAAETGTIYGVSGGINYAWGAAVPFFLFIPMVMRIRKLMPKCTTFTEFITLRYGSALSKVYLAFGIGLCFYVLMIQGVGIGIVFKSIFGLPFHAGVLVPLIIVIIYISKAGLRGSIFNDVIQFFIVSCILIITIPMKWVFPLLRLLMAVY